MIPISKFLERALSKYRYFMAQILCFESPNLSGEIFVIQYFINPIYFIELITIISVICQLEIPILHVIYYKLLIKIDPYFILGFHLLSFTLMLIFPILKIVNTNFILILRLILKNYDRILLIPCQIISMNQGSTFNNDVLISLRITNAFIIFLFALTQCYYFQSVHFLSQTLNMPFSKPILFNILLIQQIIIYQQLFLIQEYLQYVCLFYFIYLIVQTNSEMGQNYSNLYQKSNIIYTFLVCFLINNIYHKVKVQSDDMIYDFMLIVTLLVPIIFSINRAIQFHYENDTTNLIFYQIYYYQYQNQCLNRSDFLIFQIMHWTHYKYCVVLKCPCKQIEQPYKETDVIQIILVFFKNFINNDQNFQARSQLQITSEQCILKYILFLYDISRNTIQAHQTLLNQRQAITNGYLLTILQVLEVRLQVKLQTETWLQTNSMIFIREMKLLKFEGIVLQQELHQVFMEKFKFYESLKTRNISNFQKLYQFIFDLQIKVLNILKNSERMQIYNNKKNTHNIFALRISHLISYLIQNLREQTINQTKIEEIISAEIYKDDEFTNIAFTSNNAISLVAQLSEKESAEITSKISIKQLKFLQLNENVQLTSISQILHPSFKVSHQKLIDQYLQKGQSKIVGMQFETTISPDANLIVPVKLILFPYFPKEYSDKFQLIAYLLKITHKNNAIVILDYNYNIQSVDQKFLWLLESYQLQLGQINLYQMIPQLKENISKFHSADNLAKSMYFQNQSIQIFNRFSRPQLNKKLNVIKNLDHSYQLSKIEQVTTTQTVNSISVENISLIDYEISLQSIQYETDDGLEYYVYYKLVIDLTQFENKEKNNENEISVNEEQEQAKVIYRKISKKNQEDHENQEQEYVRSLHSRNSTATIVKSSDDVLQYISSKQLPIAIKNFILLSSLNTVISLLGLFIIYALLLQKRSEQDVCFNKLFYGTEFLDYYGLILKGSRHTVFYRDFNKYLNQSQNIAINESDQLIVSISDKINFTLLLYQKNCKNLITLFEQYRNYLNGYQDIKLINFKFVGYQVDQVQIQIIQTQAGYYELMNTVFYLAMKTFAGDPSLYLEGITDTFAQINTRAILFLNFNDVCDITQQFIESCLLNSQEYNNSFDEQVQTIFYIFYVSIIFFYAFLMFLLSRVILKIKQLLQIFQRLDSRDIDEELNKLEFIIQNIQIEDFWYNSKFFTQFYEIVQDLQINKNNRPQTLNLKLDDKFNLPNYYILQTLAVILLIIFFLIFQIQYNSYSNEINPIVNTALSAIQIRLNFIKLINNWDVYNYQSFYYSFQNIKDYSPYMNQNIRGNNKLLQLVELNYTEITMSSQIQAQEPFTNITKNLPFNVQHSLLLNDICVLLDCNMKIDIFFDRFNTKEILPYFQVGLIQLYQQTFQVTQSLGVMHVNSSSYESFAIQFLNTIYSREYFIYIFWGLDATNYQLKLFSDYFIQVAKDQLTSQTETIIVLLFGIGLLISLLLVSITALLIYQVVQNYFSVRFCIRFIPIKVMITKNIIQQIKMII